MNMRYISFMSDWLDRILKTKESEQIVSKIKDKVQSKVDKVTETMVEQGKLQRKIIHKTTTYYLAKVSGGLK